MLIHSDLKPNLLHRVREGALSDWGREILGVTSARESVLEVGSGTGEISLRLAVESRRVTLLDLNPDSLAFAKECAVELGVRIGTAEADALEPLPFADGVFDCVWSSGLLEHFTVQERQIMLREQGRITRSSVIALVPNAACLAYRVGKTYQEEHGIWPYGLETPVLSLRDDFEAAGLRVVAEYSVGAKHALSFLPTDHLLRKALTVWMEGKSEKELQDYGQGYLLVTIGRKAKPVRPC